MKEMRPALWSDMERLKAIWKLCFGDGDSFIDFYFARRFQPEQVAVYLVDQVITAMLTMIPIQYVDGPKGEKTRQGAMLYAIATHPDFQRRGIASELMEWARSYLGSRQVELCVLVPAEEKLFGFYERQGYQAGFTLREAVLNRDEIRVMGKETPDFAVAAALPQTYNTIRNQLLRGTAYIAYGEEEVAYQKQVSRLSGADLYALSSGGVQGCAAVECLTEDKVLVKELLVPEALIAQGLKALAQTIPAQEFIIRTPTPWGQAMGGQIRSFGMLKRTSYREWRAVAPEDGVWGKTAYLGLAFD